MPTHVNDDAAVDAEVLEAFKALSNPVRLRILYWLRDPRAHFPQERAIADPDEVGVCVSHITEKAQLAQSTVSAYMSTLESAGLVISTRVGKWTHYRRNEERIQQFVGLLGRNL
jgi:ArsR family transcriptional regulator